ncbi:MAG: PQQ-binding-like beta-propeller repeat protein [Opitutales bacterium]|nr:PQQ-binding-like beta-propeller repeat protein [Opitutales bacterium]
MKCIFKKKFLLLFSIVHLANLAAESLSSDDWPNWRGPAYNGSMITSHYLPHDFSKSKGVKWKAQLPGPSAATPIVVGENVFVSSIAIDSSGSSPAIGELMALCYNRNDGGLAWSHNAGSGYRPSGDGFDYKLDSKSNYASPSPVSNGKFVVFFYGNGDLACFKMDGTRVWSRNIQKDYGNFCFQWTFSASPTFYQDRLYLAVLQRDEPVHGRGIKGADSYILCINPENGKTIWKVIRPSSAKKESLEAFGTIIPVNGQLVIAGGDVLTGHDPLNGVEMWRWGTWNPGHRQEWWRLVPSPVYGDGVLLVCAPKRAPVYAIRSGLVGNHGPKSGLIWNSSDKDDLTSDVPTPLFYENKFFILSDLKKSLSRVDPSTGEVEWCIDLPGKYKWRSSPSAGNGMIFVMNHNASILVVASETGKILNLAKMGEEYEDNVRSSVSISKGNLFIRTNKNLYCIE